MLPFWLPILILLTFFFELILFLLGIARTT